MRTTEYIDPAPTKLNHQSLLALAALVGVNVYRWDDRAGCYQQLNRNTPTRRRTMNADTTRRKESA